MVNPYNGHEHTEGRTRIASLPPDQQAKVIVPLLLYSFHNRFDEDGFIYQMHHDMDPWAPWTWSAADPVLASAVSARLRELVFEGSCVKFKFPNPRWEAAEVRWAAMKKRLEGHIPNLPDDFVGDVDKSCNACGFTPSLNVSFQRCARCKYAYYSSKGCQKEDWKSHKKSCTPAA